ncbi:hypothetical protein Plhal304r1_c003g0010591 [Plasmopara halstedii]
MFSPTVIDASGVDSYFNADLMLKRFSELEAQPMYCTLRDGYLDAVVTTSTQCVYFRSTQCPSELHVRGSVRD